MSEAFEKWMDEKGPWVQGRKDCRECWQEATRQAEARSQVEIVRLTEALRELEWAGEGGLCPSCHGSPTIPHHDEDCKLAAALAALRSSDADGSKPGSGCAGLPPLLY